MEIEFVVEDIRFGKIKDTPYIRRHDQWSSTEQVIKHYYKTYKDFKPIFFDKIPKWVQKLSQKGNVRYYVAVTPKDSSNIFQT